MPRSGVSKSTAVTADYSDVAAIQQRMVEAAEALSGMAENLAKARQIREYDSDRKKSALAQVAAPLLRSGESAAAADLEARASDNYRKAMKQLATELRAAEEVIAKHEAVKIQWETARSLLAMQRDMTRQL